MLAPNLEKMYARFRSSPVNGIMYGNLATKVRS